MVLLGMVGERNGVKLLVRPVENRYLLFVLRRFRGFLKYRGYVLDILKDIPLQERMSCRLRP